MFVIQRQNYFNNVTFFYLHYGGRTKKYYTWIEPQFIPKNLQMIRRNQKLKNIRNSPLQIEKYIFCNGDMHKRVFS